jgi:hypothetical protein
MGATARDEILFQTAQSVLDAICIFEKIVYDEFQFESLIILIIIGSVEKMASKKHQIRLNGL